MKPLINLFAGFTGGAAVLTGMMVILNEKMVIGPFFGVTVALAAFTVGIKYVDWRLRENLKRLLTSVEGRVSYADYLRILDLKHEIQQGLSLSIASEKIGELAHELDFDTEIESPHV